MINRPLLSLLLILSSAGLRADESVRSTQEELRRRNVYFGDVDGRKSPELESALKRYQGRKGLAATGREDRETLRSLGLATREQGEALPNKLEWPEEPVLKSDTKIDVLNEAQEIAATTGVSLSSLLPDPVATGNRKSAPTKRRTNAGATAATGSPPRTTAGSVRFVGGQSEQTRGEVAKYVRDYLQAVGRNRLEDELHFYADRVDYLGNGKVDRRIIEQSLRNYYQRWPNRSYAQTGAVSYRAVPARGEIVVSFLTDFSLKSSQSKVRGKTAVEMVINTATADPRIVAIKEQRVRR